MPDCRNCPKKTRARCIEECATSDSVKLMMHRAFESGTDTTELWGLLQADCLIEKMDRRSRMPRPSALRQRLKDKAKPKPVEATEKTKKIIPAAPVIAREPTRRPTPIQSRLGEKRKEKQTPSRYCLTLQGEHHRIALPRTGSLVLGRFDPTIKASPDVDLSYDDRNHRVISRRHARITGHNGRHEIEDLGSTNGTRVNGKRLKIGQKVQLKPDDQVALGRCQYTYASIPKMQISSHTNSFQAYLRVAFTGRRFPLPTWGEGIIGRRDEIVGLTPDIDLSEEKEAAHVIARRHVKILVRNGRHYAEDLGSTTGTKLNGVPLTIGKMGLLNPGDHLWLGGCVLTYDVEQDPEEATRILKTT